MTDANLLASESSPYLLQHADNLVRWRPWGAAALEEARRKNRPLLVSIGYAACHWCHVMAHESFEDAGTADLMNAFFVNVKIDREERPDIDHLYMSALHAMGEQGGWPLTMFATPDGLPFWGGTYFPPQPRWGKPGFPQVLRAIDSAWRERGAAILQSAAAIATHLTQLSTPQPGASATPDDLRQAARGFLNMIDPRHGGLGGAPKFPNAPIFRFLWNEFFRSGDENARKSVRDLLDAMSQGGIYDHLGGGYARYSVDAQWLAPHFEKMLYDNAQALELLARAHAQQETPLYAARARETVGWMLREMRVDTPAGQAFAAAQDADQDGEEGLFYTWRAEDVDAILGEDSDFFKQVYDVRPEGNWEGVTILRRRTHLAGPDHETQLQALRAKLFAAREGRPKPARDDKILADWNGLAIAALAKAACTFDQPDWLRAAQEAFAAVDRALRDADGDLAHAWRGKVSAIGQLDDYAAMARAALALFEARGAPEYLEKAVGWAERAIDLFGAEDGGFYLVSVKARDVPIVRPRHAQDQATPAGAGLMAEVAARLAHLTGEDIWRARAERTISAFSGDGAQLPMSPTLLAAADLLARGRVATVSAARPDLLKIARAASDPAVCALARAEDADISSAPAAVICQGQTCGPSIEDPKILWETLNRAQAPQT